MLWPAPICPTTMRCHVAVVAAAMDRPDQLCWPHYAEREDPARASAFRVMGSQFSVGLGWVTLARLGAALYPNRDLRRDNFANCFPCTLTKAFPRA